MSAIPIGRVGAPIGSRPGAPIGSRPGIPIGTRPPNPIGGAPPPAPSRFEVFPTPWQLDQWVAHLDVNFNAGAPNTTQTWTANKRVDLTRIRTVKIPTGELLAPGMVHDSVIFNAGNVAFRTPSGEAFCLTRNALVNLSGTEYCSEVQTWTRFTQPAPFLWDVGVAPLPAGDNTPGSGWACTEHLRDIDIERWRNQYYYRGHRQFVRRRKVPVLAATFNSAVGQGGLPGAFFHGTYLTVTQPLVCTHEEVTLPDHPTGTWYIEQTWERYEALASLFDPTRLP